VAHRLPGHAERGEIDPVADHRLVVTELDPEILDDLLGAFEDPGCEVHKRKHFLRRAPEQLLCDAGLVGAGLVGLDRRQRVLKDRRQ
jgi:hypothetical protein